MVTVAHAHEAERLSQLQRLFHGRHLVVVETGASEADLKLAARVKSAALGDGHSFDTALADRRVNDLFERGILIFTLPQQQPQKGTP